MKSSIITILLALSLGSALAGQSRSGVFIHKTIPIHITQTPQLSKVITGIIKDKSGEPVVGASIGIIGSRYGTTSGADGQFSLKIPKELRAKASIRLSISFIGMKTKEVTYKGKALTVILEEKVSSIQDIVVTGYHTVDRRTVASSITTLQAEELLVPGIPTLDVALQGRVPDLVFTNNSGAAGATGSLRIRGSSTILGNREPLWVVDGFVVTDPVNVDPQDLNNPDYINIIGNAISGLNPQDIDRIDILKDASATALYGTQAANGVIVVTTKQGREGPATVKIDTQLKYKRRPRYTDRGLDLMTSAERVAFGKELVDLHYVFPETMPMVGYEGAYAEYMRQDIDFNTFLAKVNRASAANTDWFDLLCEDAFSPNSTLTISGGNKRTRYYVSLGFNDEKGVVKREQADRYTGRANLTMTLTDKFRVNLSFSGNVQKKFHGPQDISVVDFAYNTSRAIPAFEEDGSYYMYKIRPYQIGRGIEKFSYNILNELDNSYRKFDGAGMVANVMMNYNLTPNLRLNLGASYSKNHTTQEAWWGEKSTYVAQLRNSEYGELPLKGEAGNSELPFGGVQNTNVSSNESWTIRFQPDFNKRFQAHHLFSLSGGIEARSNAYDSYTDKLRGFMRDRGLKFISDVDLEDYPHYKNWLNKVHRTVSHNETNAISAYGTMSYSYGYHFTFNVNGRVDYSNRFGSRANERFLPIWSVATTYNASENILKNVKWISEFRFRGSYGHQGNVPNAYPSLVTRKGALSPYYNEYTSTIAAFPNPNLRWEDTHQVNLALEAAFFKQRLRATIETYYKRTDDAFVDVAVSSVNGLVSNKMNGGSLVNKGVSFSLSYTPLRTRYWYGVINGYVSRNLNRVLSGSVETYQWGQYLSGQAVLDAYPLSSFFSYKYIGLNPKNGAPMFDDYMDKQHLLKDMSLEEEVKTVMEYSGTRDPIVTGGFSTSLSYKHFSLSTSWYYSLGAKMRLFSLYEPVFQGVGAQQNLRKIFNKRWRAPGDEVRTDYPAIISTGNPDYLSYVSHYSSSPGKVAPQFANNVWQMYDQSNLRVVPADYLRLTSVSLRYRLAKKELEKLHLPLAAAEVSLNGTNLFVIASKQLHGQDPMQAGFNVPQMAVRPTYTLQFSLTF